MAKVFDKAPNNIYDAEIHKNIEDYVFKGVNQLKEHEWLTSLSGYELAQLWDKQQLVYYPTTQRGTVEKNNKKGKKEEVVHSKKNIKEIQALIAKGKYFPDTLTLNILSEDGEVEYNQETLSLEIKSGLICLLDGYHRITALYNIYRNMMILQDEYDVDLSKLMFPVKITNYDENVAAQQFYQYQLGLKINTSRAESFNTEDAENRIVNELNRISILKGMINCYTNSISKDDEEYIVTFGTLVTAIRDSFGKIKNEEIEDEILDFLKQYFKELVKQFPEMINPQKRIESREDYLICENFMFYVWIHFAKQLYLQRKYDWKEKMSYLPKLDYYKGSDVWSDIIKPTKNGGWSIINNKTTRRNAIDIFTTQMFECANKEN